MSITTRPATDEDREILAEIYASTQREQLAALPLPDEQKDALIRRQFEAQHAQFHAQHPAAEFLVLLRDGEVIGRLYVDRGGDAIRLIDIALLPDHRGKGLGTRLLRDLIAEAAQAGKPLQLWVQAANPARRLYERLGFRTLEDDGVYRFLEWRAES